MVKMIALLKRRPGMSRDEFRDYYEANHAPLAAPYMMGAIAYERRYLDPVALPTDSSSDPVEDFDAIVEISFENREDLEATMAGFADPQVAEIIAEDELKLFDRSATRAFVVETICATEVPTAAD